jgi:hypothetical protein
VPVEQPLQLAVEEVEVSATIESAPPVQAETQAKQPEAIKPKLPQELPVERQVRQAKDIPPAAPKRRQEIMQKTEVAGIEKSPKPTEKRKKISATGVVSRDREALARLLTSF